MAGVYCKYGRIFSEGYGQNPNIPVADDRPPRTVAVPDLGFGISRGSYQKGLPRTSNRGEVLGMDNWSGRSFPGMCDSG